MEMEQFTKNFVFAVLSFVSEKIKMAMEDVKEIFFNAIWDEYLASNKAKDIIKYSLPKTIAPGATILAVLEQFGITDYAVVLDNKMIVRSTASLKGKTIQIEPGTTHFDKWMALVAGEDINEIIIPDTVSELEEQALSQTQIETIIFPEKVSTIPGFVCSNCYNLRAVTLHNVTKIGYGAFMYCESLNEINIPASLQKIDKNAFKGCVSLPDELRKRIMEIGGPEALGEDNESYKSSDVQHNQVPTLQSRHPRPQKTTTNQRNN